MATPRALVCTHGHCLDGFASAALFGWMLTTTRGPRELDIRSCGYGPGFSQVPPGWLDADENAILDFRYTESKALHFYFDHHPTAFGSTAERDDAIATRAPRVVRWDPRAPSCARVLHDNARDVFGMTESDLTQVRDLVSWVDKVDAARFEDVDAATSLDDPALGLAAVVEQHGDTPFLKQWS
ncbi:MAG: hypothetical protein R3F49_25625, partial [Planctomycetota bacterium]